ncbi:MAG: hypothetical protein JXA37_11240 [Chloroflexia bacterium]|nr:hypothetical protein [Chloroflexia bacterium]
MRHKLSLSTFPAGLRVADPLLYSVSPECGSPTFSPAVGAGSMTFADGTILGGDECTINLQVTADEIGVYVNSSEPVASAAGVGNAASATLRAGGRIYLPLAWK